MTAAANQRREDILVSVCVPVVPVGADAVRAVERLSQALAARFRYAEIILAFAEDADHPNEDALARLGNVRLVRVRHGTAYYRCRAAVAAEAIGDVVAIVAVDELAADDVVAMIERADATSAIIAASREGASIWSPLLATLGRGAGFRVNAETMLSSAYPRTLLNQLLAHPEREIALRFPPADRSLAVLVERRAPASGSRSIAEAGRRLDLIQRLVVSSAPVVLSSVAMLSLVVVVTAIAFAIYSVVVWATLDTIQPGWFTTSFALSMTAMFLGLAIFGLSIGLQKVIALLQRGEAHVITGEGSGIDLFGQVVTELNVEVEHAALADAVTAPPVETLRR